MVGKLVPRMHQSAKILYSIYIVMTIVEIILLLLGGMPLFDSVLHSFGTAALEVLASKTPPLPLMTATTSNR